MRRTLALMMAGCLLALAPVAAWANQPGDQLEEQLVAGADTPAEHQALAAYYRDKAAEARKHAKHHEAMAKRYTGAAYKGRNVPEHCNKLVALNEQAAVEYEALAKAQEAAAAQ